MSPRTDTGPCEHPVEARRTNVGMVRQVYEVCSACEQRVEAEAAAPALDVERLREAIVDTMLNDGPEDTVYTVADRIVARLQSTDPEPPESDEAFVNRLEAEDGPGFYDDPNAEGNER